MTPIKNSSCPNVIKYVIYAIKYPTDPIKLTQWLEITNVTGTQLPG